MLIIENIANITHNAGSHKADQFYMHICIYSFAPCLINLTVYCENFATSWAIFQEHEFQQFFNTAPNVDVNSIPRHVRSFQFFSIVNNANIFLQVPKHYRFLFILLFLYVLDVIVESLTLF